MDLINNHNIIYKELPLFQNHEYLVFQYKHKNENIGVVKTIDFHDVFFSTIYNFKQPVINFLKNIQIDYSIPDIIIKNDNEYKLNVEHYIKTAWVTYEYIINNETFNNPIMLHWNPRIEKWCIHPGGTRQKIIYFFNKGKINNPLIHNTTGKQIDFFKIFYSKKDIENYYQKEVIIVATADHGSIIPHVHFDQENIQPNIKKYYKTIKQFWQTTDIMTDLNLEYFGYKKPIKKVLKTLRLEVDNPENIDNISKALYIIPFFDNFDKYGVRIKKV